MLKCLDDNHVLQCPKFGLLITRNITDNVHFKDVATLHVLERDVRVRGGEGRGE